MFSRNYCLSSIFILFLLLWSLFLMFCRNCCLSSIFILFLLLWSLFLMFSRNCCLSCISILFLLSWSLFSFVPGTVASQFDSYHFTTRDLYFSNFEDVIFAHPGSYYTFAVAFVVCFYHGLIAFRHCRLLLCLSLAASLCCDLLSSIVLDGPNGLYLFCR